MKKFNKIQRNFAIVLVAICLVSISSGCKKLLDTQKQGEYTADDYPYPSGSGAYDQYLFGAYNDLRSYSVHVDGFIAATSIRSDDADKGSTAADGGSDLISMDNFPMIANNSRANALWVGYYALISKCNVTLDKIDNDATIIATDAVKIQSRAEAKFLRGYAYFMLVRLFGRVPLVDKLLTVEQSNVPQSTPAQIYTLIEADLTFAAANLPVSWESKFVGRLTKGAANGLLAKVYLTQQKWAVAISAASAVITSGQYDLSTPYDKIFSEAGENSKESVFEVQATANATVKTNNGIQYASFQGLRGAGAGAIWNMGWGFNTPSTSLEAAYEPGDPRKARTILYTSTATTPGLTIYGETTPIGLPNPRYNNKVYTNPTYRASVNDYMGYWMNVRILRYADVVLMYAEAANEVGGAANTTIALTALNSIRARARNGNNAILLNVTTTDQTALRLAIQQERRVELAMEHERFFDIVRWGISQSAMTAAGKTAFSASRDNLLPIPQTQIDLSKGVLTQNFGY